MSDRDVLDRVIRSRRSTRAFLERPVARDRRGPLASRDGPLRAATANRGASLWPRRRRRTLRERLRGATSREMTPEQAEATGSESPRVPWHGFWIASTRRDEFLVAAA